MNNLFKEVSAYLLNDNQIDRAINTISIEIAKPLITRFEQEKEGKFGIRGINPECEAYFRFALQFIMLLGWVDDDYEPEFEGLQKLERAQQKAMLKDLIDCCELRIKEVEEMDNERQAEKQTKL